MLQRKDGQQAGDLDPGAIHQAASLGASGAGEQLPHLDRVQQSFGHHDVSSIQAHTDAEAQRASESIGAAAYATGNHVAFAGTPDLHTAAHEAAHVVQQRAGVALAGGVGQAGDPYEQHADRVADVVVQGGDAAPLLDTMAGRGGDGGGVQRAVQREGAGTPDLAVASVNVNQPIIASGRDPIMFTTKIANRGDGPAAKVLLQARLSLEKHPTDKDIKDIQHWIHVDTRPLPPGEARSYAIGNATMPVGSKGKWYPGVTIDPSGLQPDSDRTNNTGYAAEQLIVTDSSDNGAADPRLGYSEQAKAAAGTIDNEPLPYEANHKSWNAREILSKWTQVDGYKEDSTDPMANTSSDETRCGPTALIASVIMDGPAALYALCGKISNRGVAKMSAVATSADPKQTLEISAANAMVIGAMTAVAMGTATYGVLSQLAHATKVIMTASSAAIADGHDMVEMAKMTGQATAIGKMIENRAMFESFLAALQVGEKYMVNIDTDVRPESRGTAGRDYLPSSLNHWVMIAAVRGTSKRLVLYDPYPKDGGQITFSDDARFWKPFENDKKPDDKTDGHGTWRGCMIASKSGTPVK